MARRSGRCRALPAATLAVVAAAASVLAAVVPPPVAAHSSMTVPTSISYTTDCRVGGPAHAQRNCPGPCPNVMLKEHGPGSSPREPAATYARGELVTLRWSRNNHEGGFVRWALVPVRQMGDAAAHERFAFHWGCWSAGRFVCTDENRKALCIDDRLSERYAQAFSARVEIPTVVPDGDYVLSFAWYGGVRDNAPWRRPVRSSFGDYYDCSYVRISGGKEQVASQPRIFLPGESTRFSNRCVASVNALSKCDREPCTEDHTEDGKSLFTGGELVPVQFEDGAVPPPLLASDYAAIGDTPVRLPQTPPSPSTSPSPSPSPAPSPSSSAGEVASNSWVGVKRFYVVNTRGVRTDTLSFSSVNTVSAAAYPDGFSVEVVTRGNVPVQAVTFSVNGRRVRTERRPRWSLAGDHKGYWAPWRKYPKGRVFTLRAQPSSAVAARKHGRSVRLRVVA